MQQNQNLLWEKKKTYINITLRVYVLCVKFEFKRNDNKKFIKFYGIRFPNLVEWAKCWTWEIWKLNSI